MQTLIRIEKDDIKVEMISAKNNVLIFISKYHIPFEKQDVFINQKCIINKRNFNKLMRDGELSGAFVRPEGYSYDLFCALKFY